MTKTLGILLAASLLLLGACGAKEEAPAGETTPKTEEVTPGPGTTEEGGEEDELVAVAALQSRGDMTVAGSVTFSQWGDSVEVVAEVRGVSPGPHGFHIHEIGDCSAPDFTSAGGHFNPGGTPHAGPSDPVRHAGDLGNIEIGEDGSGFLTISSSLITLAPGPNSVVGRAVILHEKADDLVSQPTGDAGGRIACGIIELEGGEEEGGEAAQTGTPEA